MREGSREHNKSGGGDNNATITTIAASHRRMTQDKTKPLRYQDRSIRPVATPPRVYTNPRPPRTGRDGGGGGDDREKKCHRATISRERTSLPTRTVCDAAFTSSPLTPTATTAGPFWLPPLCPNSGRFPTAIVMCLGPAARMPSPGSGHRMFRLW